MAMDTDGSDRIVPPANPTLTPDQVARATAELLDETVIGEPRRIERGWGNENWMVETKHGRVVVKVSPAAFDGHDKWRAATVAHQLAETAGVPVPGLLRFVERCDALDGRMVRVVQHVNGSHPADVLGSEVGVRTFFESFGRALARLHSVSLPGFTSRIGGGAPVFDTWDEYVAYRIPQIAGRAATSGAFSAAELGAILDRASRMARSVSPVVEPRLTHRDLYLDNILAGDDARMVAILDFDNAEAWDPAVDFVKLRWQVFPHIPGAAPVFMAAYGAASGGLPRLEERLRVLDVLELANNVANARLTSDARYEQTNRSSLAEVLAARW